MTPPAPIDVPTRETVDFVAAHSPAGTRVLEIGCGAGHVALVLAHRGYRVTAIDSDPDSVSAAQQRGACATEATWPDFTCEPVAAIVLTRSFHHIGSLDEAVTHCLDVLTPDGLVLVEDFSFETADPATVRWFVETLRSRRARALMAPSLDEFVTELTKSSDPFAAWQLGHDHDLHSWKTMRAALDRHLTIVSEQTVPYLYRYLVPSLPESNEAVAFVEYVLDAERGGGGSGAAQLIGRRLVACRGKLAPLGRKSNVES